MAGPLAAARVALWDGSTWSSLQSGVNSTVTAIAEYDGSIYVGGYFSEAGGIPAWFLARWTGWSWATLDHFDSTVHALKVFQGELYVGGSFYTIGGEFYGGIASFDGNAWHQLGTGLDGSVHTMVEHQGALIVAGSIDVAGGIEVGNIAGWDGNDWHSFGQGVGDYVGSVASFDGYLVAGGNFEEAGGLPADGLAFWDGFSWREFNGGVATFSGAGADVNALLPYEGRLYVGGQFQLVDGLEILGLAVWGDGQWSACGLGVNGRVRVLYPWGDGILVGGYYSVVDDPSAYHIGVWLPDMLTDIPGEDGTSTTSFSEMSCSPNPFVDNSIVYLSKPGDQVISLSVYDIRGRKISEVSSMKSTSTGCSALWDGRNQNGQEAPAGLYFFVAHTPRERFSARVVKLH